MDEGRSTVTRLNFVSLIINSNVFIAFAALALTISTQIQLNFGPEWHPYLFIIFFATLFEYNLHRLITVLISKDALHSLKHEWVLDNKLKFYGFVLFSLLGFTVSAILAEIKVLEVFALIALLTIFYSLPVGNRSKKLFRLREIPYLKLFVIAFVWSTTTILLPVIHARQEVDNVEVLLMLVERFLFILAITIPFDIRDLDVDQSVGFRTIPIRIGERKSLLLSYFLLLIFISISVGHYLLFAKVLTASALFISGLITTYVLSSAKLRESKWYYYGILDGMMIVQGVFVVFFNLYF